MEAEDALHDLLLEIAQQESALATAATAAAATSVTTPRGSSRESSGAVAGPALNPSHDGSLLERRKTAQPAQEKHQEKKEEGENDGDEDEDDEEEVVGEEEDEEEDANELASSTFPVREVTEEASKRISQAIQKEWWRTLPDLIYVVTKVNHYGKRQTRTLRLTAEGIENVRKNGKVSSMFPYEAVVRVYMKNVKAFVIDYQNAKHSYQYRSTVAMHIVQEITSRLALRRKDDRSLTPEIATRLQEKLQRSGWHSLGNVRPERSTSTRRTMNPNAEERRVNQIKKVNTLLGNTEQQRLESAIDTIILDDHTPEGKTLKQFCNNFAVLEKNPATLVMNVRQFIDDMRDYIIERHASELNKLAVEYNAITTQEELSLNSAVEYSLERALITRFRHRIVSSLKKPAKEDEMQLKRNLTIAATKPQQFFGVAEEHVSASGWTSAVAELQALDDWDLPFKLLGAILASAKSIYATLNNERNRDRDPDQKQAIFLSADDFFPIFLFVVTRANLKNPLLISEYLWGLCDPEQLNGEGGYYLTVFCSAFQYLKDMEIEEDNECQQREEEAIKYLDDKVLMCDTVRKGTELTTAQSVDSYFAADKKDPYENLRQRTTSSPDKGEKAKKLIQQRLEMERQRTDSDARITIGSSECRAAQEAVDAKEKAKEREKQMAEKVAWPTEAVRKRTATLRAAEQAAVDHDTTDSAEGVELITSSSGGATASRRQRGMSKYGTDRTLQPQPTTPPPPQQQPKPQQQPPPSMHDVSRYDISQTED